MTEPLLLKDQVFNQAKVARISQEIQQVFPAFAAEAFVQEVLGKFPELELKARIAWISTCLKKYLPSDYRQALAILLQALPPACNPDLSDNDFGDFIYAAYSEFVSQYGCRAADLQVSLDALKAFTTRFSAEGPIRSFLNTFPEQTLQYIEQWAKDPHYHVRRLASEGTRPKLPWAQKINLAPEAALPVLDRLHADPTRFVTRSVANHLNDLSKIKPEMVLNRLQAWRQQQQQSPAELDFITRHALRTLVKKGHPETLAFLGYPTEPKIRVSDFVLAADQLQIGQTLHFSFALEALQSSKLVVDYCLHFQTKKGTLTSKVFKLRTLDLKAGESLSLQKKHPLREMTTRQLYPGRHQLELQINGQRYGQQTFLLTSAD